MYLENRAFGDKSIRLRETEVTHKTDNKITTDKLYHL